MILHNIFRTILIIFLFTVLQVVHSFLSVFIYHGKHEAKLKAKKESQDTKDVSKSELTNIISLSIKETNKMATRHNLQTRL